MRKSILIMLMLWIGYSLELFAFTGSININSGPAVRVPGITTPTVLQASLSGAVQGQLRWTNRNGNPIGTGATLSITTADEYTVWDVVTTTIPGEPNTEQFFFVAKISIPDLEHHIDITDGTSPISDTQSTTLCVRSNAFSYYAMQISWQQDSWTLPTVGDNMCRSTILPGNYKATITYTGYGQSVTIPTGIKTVSANVKKPFLQQPIEPYNPTKADLLVVTNPGNFSTYKIMKNNVEIASPAEPSYHYTSEGYYRVGGRLSSSGVLIWSPEFYIPVGDVESPSVNATNDGIIKYDGGTVQLSVVSGYTSYAWFKEGLNIPNATFNVVTVTKSGNYSVQVCLGVTCTTSNTYQVRGEVTSVNSVSKRNAMVAGTKSVSQLIALPATQKIEQTSYLDGFARPLAEVSRRYSPSGKDLVTVHKYDSLGREAKKILPFARTTTDGAYYYTPNSLQPVINFYQGSDDHIANSTVPFAETAFENSPLNRVLKQGAPGEEWQLNTEHINTVGYYGGRASDNVWIFAASGADLASSGFYPDGALTVIEMTDEAGNHSREFKNKLGQKILTETIIEAGVKLRTYFVFDDLGRLSHVVPPKAVAALSTSATVTITAAVLAAECYVYSYDERSRLTAKSVPGGGSTYTVYDQWDRVVLMQTPDQRTKNKWLFNKYDIFNRMVLQGEITLSGDYTAARNAVNTYYAGVASSPALRYESRDVAIHGYTNNSYPRLTNALQAYTVNYYDDYSILSEVDFGTSYRFILDSSIGASANSLLVRGLVTATKSQILGTSNYLKTVNYYDTKHRLIQTVSNNHINGFDRIMNVIDFAGRTVKLKNDHKGITDLLTLQEYDYDVAGRKLRTFHNANQKLRVLLCEYHYNELGQVVEKNIHGSPDGTKFLQSEDYTYTIRGWMEQMNPLDTESNVTFQDQYSFTLSYTSPLGATSDFHPQFNGNIASFTQQRAGADLGNSTYNFSYDARNQLTKATYLESGSNNMFDMPQITYDKNGNILTLKRKARNSTGVSELIDDLQYTYYGNGNQLYKVDDSGNASKGFINR
jgi:hypothetical protein